MFQVYGTLRYRLYVFFIYFRYENGIFQLDNDFIKLFYTTNILTVKMCCFSIGAHDAYWVRIKTCFAQIEENLESHAKYTI